VGTRRGREVAVLARHGLEHQLLPGEINFRANIWALKSLGVRTVIGVSAVGSLRQEIHPGDLALPSQYLDFTRGTRAASFFGGGLVAHVSSAQPTCRATAALIARVARSQDVMLHEDRTYACVEGPRLGTRAESLFLRTAGADLVGMTNVPEAFLALEAQLGYCTIAVVTDYDCWLEDPTQHEGPPLPQRAPRRAGHPARANDAAAAGAGGFSPELRRALAQCLPSPSRGRRQKSTSTASKRYCAPGAPEDGSGSNAPRHARPAHY